MTRMRVAAALAAMLTALVVQATLISPLTGAIAVSLPAVLVATVALAEGPGAGMSLGFALGLVTDLGSRHPAGILALSWLGLGLAAGVLSARRSKRADVALAAVLCTLAAVASAVLLTVVHADGASIAAGVSNAIPALLGDVLLAIVVVPLVRTFVGAQAMRSPTAIGREVVLGAWHA